MQLGLTDASDPFERLREDAQRLAALPRPIDGEWFARQNDEPPGNPSEKSGATLERVGSEMSMSVAERTVLIENIQEALAQGTLEIGEAVRRLRVEVTGLHQTQFARMCKISVRTLVHIEHGEGNQTLKSLNAVFRPFGLKMGVVRIRREIN